MDNLFNILELAKALLAAEGPEEQHEGAAETEAEKTMGKFSPRENPLLIGPRDVVRVEEATADFAHGDGERVYVYCRTEIYRAADWKPDASGLLWTGSDPVAQGPVATGTSEAPAAAKPAGLAPQAPGGWKELLHRVKGLPPDAGVFARGSDETHALWRKVSRENSLWEETQGLCPFSAEKDFKYEHIILGIGEGKGFGRAEGEPEYFVGIPGRFFKNEQPALMIDEYEGATPFSLWQPMKGAEKLFDRIEDAGREALECAYGYWIARVDVLREKVVEV